MLKKNLKFLMLTPCLLAVICDPNEDVCGLDDPDPFVVNVENIAETYATGETLWLNGETSSFVVDGCTETQEAELVLDEEVFLDALFVLRLNNTLDQLNATVVTDASVTYDIGTVFMSSSCFDSIEYTPELSDDNTRYQYRLGIAIDTPGDYCIVNARNSAFDAAAENNAEIFDIYNTLENRIKFESCDATFTRNGTTGFYFFSVTE